MSNEFIIDEIRKIQAHLHNKEERFEYIKDSLRKNVDGSKSDEILDLLDISTIQAESLVQDLRAIRVYAHNGVYSEIKGSYVIPRYPNLETKE